MAITTVVPTVLEKFNDAETEVALAAVDATAGARIPLTEADQKILIRFGNGAAEQTATIKAGGSFFGLPDKTLTLAANTSYQIQVESGPYKQITGTNAGYIEITASDASVTVGATTLP